MATFNKIKDKNPVVVKYCIYARKSSEAEDKQALSIDSQIKEMRVISARDNLTVIDVKSEAFSAKNSWQRLVFNEVIQNIKDGKYNAILTWNTDRLSRNAGDLGQIVDLMDKGLLVEIRTFSQTFTNNPNDKFLLMILGSQAKLENDNRGINVKRGLRTRVEMGLWPGVAPTGYLDSNLKDHLCEKVLDPVRAPIIKGMFEKVGYEGFTNKQLYYWLKNIDARTAKGKYINMGSIHDILTRPFYYGQFEYPRKSGNWYQGKHTPIITRELFELVKKVLKDHSSFRGYKRTGKEPFTFARFLHCGLCGSGIVAEEKFKKLINGKFNRHVYYHCSQGRDRSCPGCYVNEQNLAEQLCGILDSVDINLVGMKDEVNKKVDRYYKFENFMGRKTDTKRTPERMESDLRKYAKIIFQDGTLEDKHGILKNLKGKLLLKDKKVYVDSV